MEKRQPDDAIEAGDVWSANDNDVVAGTYFMMTPPRRAIVHTYMP
eukprot:COSAG05_NODE_107_length_18696_cov_209.227766_12_plen_45_part_00